MPFLRAAQKENNEKVPYFDGNIDSIFKAQ